MQDRNLTEGLEISSSGSCHKVKYNVSRSGMLIVRNVLCSRSILHCHKYLSMYILVGHSQIDEHSSSLPEPVTEFSEMGCKYVPIGVFSSELQERSYLNFHGTNCPIQAS